MEITENKIFEAFGLEKTSENNQDAAAPGETETTTPKDTGANENPRQMTAPTRKPKPTRENNKASLRRNAAPMPGAGASRKNSRRSPLQSAEPYRLSGYGTHRRWRHSSGTPD